MPFFISYSNGGYNTSSRNIVIARRFFMENPQGKIITGLPLQPEWDKEQFYKWFTQRLNYKTGIPPTTEREALLQHDLRVITDYKNGIMHRGRNLLATTRLKQLFPHINNNINEQC